MLRIIVDIFSGRPNPTWIVTSANLTKQVMEAVKGDRALAGKPESGFQGLGLRAVHVQILGDEDDVVRGNVPKSFVLGTGTQVRVQQGAELTAVLIKEMAQSADIVLPEHTLTPIDKPMQELLLKELERWTNPASEVPKSPAPKGTIRRRTTSDSTCERCQYEISMFNPGFWNNNPTVLQSNNCYNYARNWRTNTFAQPGRASGHPATTMSCSAVASAAKSDGLVNRCKCLSQSEYPRRLMALVIWPGADYHWYRHQIGNFWGHKPGHTPARNTDNSGVIVSDPQTCNRGNYTNFCGYFYAGKSVKIV